MSICRKSRRRVAGGCVPMAALLLAACGEFVDNIPPRPAASDDPTIAETEYPSLASVPARPQLTYTLEQRREIAQGLVADRANARYAGDALRQDLDRPVQPDTAPPLPPLSQPATATATADPEGDLTLAYIEDALARESDDGSLGDFLDRLERRPPATAEARPGPTPPADPPGLPEDEAAVMVPTLEAAAESESEAESELVSEPVPAVEPTPEPTVEVAEQLAEPLAAADDAPVAPLVEQAVASDAPADPAPAQVAPTEVAAAEVAAGVAAPPAPPLANLPLAILFDPDRVEVAGEAQVQVQRLALQLAGDAFTVVVSGGGERAGLAMERARRVAAMLVNGGIPAARIAIEMGGESDVVVVYEAGA
jgi:outer membrane protein OmpA-like peptidoglycan-associated protein